MATPLALQLYTVRKAMAEDRGRALARAGELGFTAVEPFGIGQPDQSPADRLADARKFRAQLDDNGLRVTSVHGAVAAGGDLEPVLDELGVLGTDRLIAPVPGSVAGAGKDPLASADGVARFAEALGVAAETAASRGISVGYHNHDFEWARLSDAGNSPAYEILADRLDSRVFLEVDLYWAYAAGQDPAELVSRYADRVQLLHVKDGPGVRGELQTAVGEGVVDNGAAIDAGREVAWHILELDEAAGDPFEVAKAGGDWLVAHGYSRWQ